MTIYRSTIRPLLFRMDAETSHRATIGLCRAAGFLGIANAAKAHFGVEDTRLRNTVAGIEFPGPVGLAAGFDKNAEAALAMSKLGFGSVEVGSVSLQPSKGNPDRPRVWRLPLDEGLRIYYGCPSDGAKVVAARLRSLRFDVPLGVSLVETNTGAITSAEHAADELAQAMTYFVETADYLVLNLSCPNMPRGGGLFDLPDKLGMLLRRCGMVAKMPPVFLKITPPGDADDPRVIDPILNAVAPFGFVKGFILNIPNRDPGGTLKTPALELDQMRGGITGPSLREPTNRAIHAWHGRIDRKRHALIGCGGISSAADAYRTIRLGASLVQLYTALVYQGPGLIKTINEGLSRLLERDGFRNVGEVVGVGE